MGNVIEHVYDPAGLLVFCHRILAPGGRIVVVTPNARSLGHAYFKQDWRGLEPPRHLQIFTQQSLRKALTESGFAIASARTTNRGFWYLCGMSARLRRARQRGLRHVDPSLKLLSLQSLLRQFLGRFIQLASRQRGEELLTIGEK
jgi:hypothetical protein